MEQPQVAQSQAEQLQASKKPERKQQKGLALFQRWPKLRWQALGKPQQVLSPEVQNQFSTFASDFGLLEDHLLPSYRELSNEAAKGQNQFHLEQVILILGGVAVTTLGAIQVTLAAVTHNSLWPGLIEAVVAAILAGFAQVTQTTKSQESYFSNRLKTETLRGEYFLFLGRLKPYDDEQSRKDRLIMRVREVTRTLTDSQQLALLTRWKEVMRQRASGTIPTPGPQDFWQLYYRYRYEDQIKFYEDRTKEFKKAQSEATILTIILMTAASVVSLFGSADLLQFSTGWAVLAVFFPVLATALATYQSVYAFERQAKLYEDASGVLNSVQMPPTPGGSPDVSIQDYVEQIEYVFKMEQGQWGQLVGQIAGAIPPGGLK
ncbi:MAG TPA: DUF4231 domain-containing protein [Ktedonobacterales bacterium]|nr:DUF4231 domain-containing protein [Ktedonobacterales bacterium]